MKKSYKDWKVKPVTPLQRKFLSKSNLWPIDKNIYDIKDFYYFILLKKFNFFLNMINWLMTFLKLGNTKIKTVDFHRSKESINDAFAHGKKKKLDTKYFTGIEIDNKIRPLFI